MGLMEIREFKSKGKVFLRNEMAKIFHGGIKIEEDEDETTPQEIEKDPSYIVFKVKFIGLVS